jgi:hypothetical protein
MRAARGLLLGRSMLRGPAFLIVVVSTLSACAGRPAPAESAYDEICRSPSMTPAAAREAFWCWQQVGAGSADEWIAYEKAHASETRTSEARRESARHAD